MNLHTLVGTVGKNKKRLGQGHGSGRVKTSGRGTKGQNARSKRPLQFEGGALPLTKRLPFLRGKDRNKSLQQKPVIINLSLLDKLPSTAEVTIESLLKHHLISQEVKERGIKLLGLGEAKRAYIVKISTSDSASDKIKKAGGTIEVD